MLRSSLTILCFAALLSTPVLAADAPKGEPPNWGKCTPDLAKFKCAAAKGDEQIYQCLMKHDGELSKACDPETTKYEVLTGKPQ